MRIRLINYEIGIKEGILSKFAKEMMEGLVALGHTVSIDKTSDPKADVNHHINYISYKKPAGKVNTTMVTHFTQGESAKLTLMKKVMETCDTGVCFSKETAQMLKKNGITKTAVIHPAHTVTRRPRLVAILTDVYSDGRKREEMFEALVKQLPDKKKFVFSVIGDGWKLILEDLIKLGMQVQWQPVYNPELGQAILATTDYLLYLGEDEGAISVLDAAHMGVRTIAPNVGFHKEIGIDFPFKTQKQLNEIFEKIAMDPVEDWTWENYCKKHESLWQKLLS